MPQGDKSSYTGKQRREAHHIEEGYKKRGISTDEAERRAWATVNKQDGGGKKKSSASHSSHSGSSHGSTRSRSHSSRRGSRSRSRSRGFTLLGITGLPSWTPYALLGLGACGLIYGLMQIDSISEAVDPVLNDIGEFFGLTEKEDLIADRTLDSSMSTIQ